MFHACMTLAADVGGHAAAVVLERISQANQRRAIVIDRHCGSIYNRLGRGG